MKMKVEFDLSDMTPTQLAQLYVLLLSMEFNILAVDDVLMAGVANCGAEDFNAEIKRVREVMF